MAIKKEYEYFLKGLEAFTVWAGAMGVRVGISFHLTFYYIFSQLSYEPVGHPRLPRPLPLPQRIR